MNQSVDATSQAWIEWHGGKCPVPPLTLVFVRFQSGLESSGRGSARAYRWTHNKLGGDIVAYKVASR